MPRSTTPSTFNAISSRDQRCGSFEPKRRANGGMRWRQCDRASSLGFLRSRRVNLTTPVGLLLDEVEHSFTEGAHELLGIDRPDAANHAGAEIFLDTLD